MAGRARSKSIGAGEARRRLPELLNRAARGESTVITRRGRACAVVTPVERNVAVPEGETLLDLRGTGRGLYGRVGRYVDGLRREWP